MSKYINLDDPDVTYSHNAGNHEVYIVGSAAERIDIVRCGECKHAIKQRLGYRCELIPRLSMNENWFCAAGERRDDETD